MIRIAAGEDAQTAIHFGAGGVRLGRGRQFAGAGRGAVGDPDRKAGSAVRREQRLAAAGGEAARERTAR